MKLKQLEMLLESIEGFREPKVTLEQYETGSHIGARMLFAMSSSFDDIAGKAVVDLGTGCGRLALGCACLGAALVLAVDIDRPALDQCLQNRQTLVEEGDDEEVDLSNLDVLQADVCSDDSTWDRWYGLFDTVVMNPPFGTKHNHGADMAFLQRAVKISRRAVYSLHKRSTRDHVLRRARELGVRGQVVAELRYNLPRTYRFHQKATHDIQVDFFRFEHL